MKKRWTAGLLAGAVLLGCAGCEKGRGKPSPSVEPTELVTPAPTLSPTAEPEDVLAVYQRALKRLLEEHIDPDPEIGHYEDDAWESLGQIEFAVCDVDMDGEQELIMRHGDTYMAGQYTAVYRYDAEKGELVEKGGGTANCRFYDNGMMQDDVSHNQGWSGAFWPFTALKYDGTAQKYREIAFVDALDREFMDAYEFPGYPEEVDVEKVGFVYRIYQADADGIRWDGEVEPVSQSAYDAWYAETFGGAKEIPVKYLSLTAANVGNLHYQGVMPKVNVDINNEWSDYTMYDFRLSLMDGFYSDRLSERQNKLMANLPAEKLPREAAGGAMTHWTREDIWEDTLLPMCYDEKNDVTLYAVVTEDSIPEFEKGGYLSGAGIVLRKGDETEYYPIEHEQFWTGANPLMVVRDFDGDGKDEAAVSLLSGHGTGVAVSMLYIFELEPLYWYVDTVDFSGVDIDVAYDADRKTAVLTSGEDTLRVKVDIPDDEFNGVYAENAVRYIYDNDKLLCVLGLDFGGWTLHYRAEAVGQVVYENGKYTLGPLTLEATK